MQTWLERNESSQDLNLLWSAQPGDELRPVSRRETRLSTGFSTEEGRRWPAAGAGANLAQPGCGAAGFGRVSRCKLNRQVDRRCGQGVNRSCGRGYRAGKVRAVQWSGQNWSRAWRRLCGLCREFSGHGAVVSPVAAATGREARICVGGKDCRKRSQPRQQNHENGNKTPHRRFIVIQRT